MGPTLHEELLAAVMPKPTPSQQNLAVSFATSLSKQSAVKTGDVSVAPKTTVSVAPKTTAPKKTKEAQKPAKPNRYPNGVTVIDGWTPLATQLANEPVAPAQWLPAPRLSTKQMLSGKGHYFDDGAGVRVFQGWSL
jgi:hypothetical protein